MRPGHGYPSASQPGQLPKLPVGPVAPPPPPAGYPKLTEHPVRCPATMQTELDAEHIHECVHPAKRPDGVVGILEHRCNCGCTWSETTQRPAPDKSWLEMESHKR